MAAGLSSSGSTPWWQLPGSNRPNLEQQTPSGYEFNPVQQGYERTPTSAGQRLGAALNGLKGSGGLDGFGSMYGLSSSSGSTGPVGSSTSFPTVGYGSASAGSPSGGRVAPVTMNTGALDAADSAAFGHAKDQAAQTASAAITGLSGELQRRGMGGAGYEGGQIGGTLSREANTIGEASRAEATNRAGVAQHVADENYTGGIAQRGQDIGSEDAKFSGGIAQRGQDIGRANAQDQLTLQSQQLAQQKQIALANLFSGSVNGLVNTLSRSY